MWANLDTTSTTGIKTLFSNSAQGATTDGFRLFLNNSGTSNRRVLFETGDGTNSSSCESPNDAIVAGNWAYMTTYNNQFAPGAFYTVEAQEDEP